MSLTGPGEPNICQMGLSNDFVVRKLLKLDVHKYREPPRQRRAEYYAVVHRT